MSWMLHITGVTLAALAATACGGSKSASSGASQAQTPSAPAGPADPTAPPAAPADPAALPAPPTVPVSPPSSPPSVSSPVDVTTTSVRAGGTSPVKLPGPAGALKDASVAIQPGTLAIDTDIVVDAGADIVDDVAASYLNIPPGATSAGPALLFLPGNLNAVPELRVPVTIALTLAIGDGAHLDDTSELPERLVVLYKAISAEGGRKIGLIPRKSLRSEDGQLKFETSFFGSFQPAILPVLIEEPRTADLPATTPILTAAATAATAAPAFAWGDDAADTRSATEFSTAMSFSGDASAIDRCLAMIGTSEEPPYVGVAATVASTNVRVTFAAPLETTYHVRFQCSFRDGRVSRYSPWLTVAGVTTTSTNSPTDGSGEPLPGPGTTGATGGTGSVDSINTGGSDLTSAVVDAAWSPIFTLNSSPLAVLTAAPFRVYIANSRLFAVHGDGQNVHLLTGRLDATSGLVSVETDTTDAAFDDVKIAVDAQGTVSSIRRQCQEPAACILAFGASNAYAGDTLEADSGPFSLPRIVPLDGMKQTGTNTFVAKSKAVLAYARGEDLVAVIQDEGTLVGAPSSLGVHDSSLRNMDMISTPNGRVAVAWTTFDGSEAHFFLSINATPNTLDFVAVTPTGSEAFSTNDNNALSTYGSLQMDGSYFGLSVTNAGVGTSRFYNGSAWSIPATIPAAVNSSLELVANSATTARVAVWRSGGVYASAFNDGSWSASQALDDNGDTQFVTGGMDKNGNAVIAWRHNDTHEVWARRYVAGVWQGAERLAAAGESIIAGPRVAVSDRGEAVVLWYEVPEPGTAVFKGRTLSH